MSLVRSGRVIILGAQVALTSDLLRAEIFRMNDVSKLAQTILGGWPAGSTPSALAAGLNCNPQSPPSLGVTISPGVIYQYEQFDATAYGALPADTSDYLYKQGMLMESLNKDDLDPPPTPGDSIAYLIQARLITEDTELVARQYYNKPNPPITQSANDVRTDRVEITVKASTPAPSPVIPTPDAGKIGIWVVTVPQGATVVNSGMISVYDSGVSFINETLNQKASKTSIQNDSYNYGVDTGAADAYAVTLSPAPTAYTAGLRVNFTVANTNTGPSTINVNGLGVKNIVKNGSTPLVVSDLPAGFFAQLQYNGTNFQLLNPGQDSILAFSSGDGTLSDSNTYYLGFGTLVTSGGITAVEIPVPYDCIVSQLYVDNSGSSAGTVTYTVMKNSVATSLTCAATFPSRDAQDTTHAVSFNKGDFLSVRVVTTGGVTGDPASKAVIKIREV